MTEAPTQLTATAPIKRPRAWWQWALGITLLTAAVALLAVRTAQELRPAWFVTVTGIQPIPLRVPDGMKEGDHIAAAPGEFNGCNVLLVTLDTTRADRLGCYGNTHIKTPTLDRLATEGILFSHAVCPSPATLPSHSTMLTGLYPYHHGVRSNGHFRLADEYRTLTEILRDKHYATGAFVSAFVLDSLFGLAQGFDRYDDDVSDIPDSPIPREPERRGDKTTDRAIGWLRDHSSKPFFLWVHYYDPHQPLSPPGAFAEEYKQFPYDGEIAFVDSQLARVLAAVDEAGVREKTLVVVVGDHGEALGQHDEETHGLMLYDATMHIPFLMWCGKRLGGGTVIHRDVCSVDILPTILSLLGEPKAAPCDGLDLTQRPAGSRIIPGETLEGFYEYELAPLLSVRDGVMKYIFGPAPELFDLSKDPNEEHDLAASQGQVAAAMKKKLSDFFGDDLRKASFSQPTVQLGSAQEQKLKALGYTSAGVTSAPATGSLPDPKSVMRLVARAEAAGAAGENGKYSEAIRELGTIVREHPEFYLANRFLGETHYRAKDYANAQKVFERCHEIYPDSSYVLLMLARSHWYQKHMDVAIRYYKESLSLFPEDSIALSELGKVLSDHGDYSQAAEVLVKAFKLRTTSGAVVDQMVQALSRLGQEDEAITLLRQRLVENPRLPGVRNSLAVLLAQKKRFAEAVVLLQEGIKLFPDQDGFVNNLATVLIGSEGTQSYQPFQGVVIMEQLCRKTGYKVPEYLHTLSIAYSRQGRVDEAMAVAEQGLQIAEKSSSTKLADSIRQTILGLKQLKASGLTPMMGKMMTATQPAERKQK